MTTSQDTSTEARAFEAAVSATYYADELLAAIARLTAFGPYALAGIPKGQRDCLASALAEIVDENCETTMVLGTIASVTN